MSEYTDNKEQDLKEIFLSRLKENNFAIVEQLVDWFFKDELNRYKYSRARMNEEPYKGYQNLLLSEIERLVQKASEKELMTISFRYHWAKSARDEQIKAIGKETADENAIEAMLKWEELERREFSKETESPQLFEGLTERLEEYEAQRGLGVDKILAGIDKHLEETENPFA